MITSCAKCGSKLARNSTRCKKCKTQSNDLQLNTKKPANIAIVFFEYLRQRPLLLRLIIFVMTPVCGIVLSLVFFPRSSSPPQSQHRSRPPAYAMFEKVGDTIDASGNGEVDFLLIRLGYMKNLFRLRTACKAYADKYQSTHANLYVWSDPKLVATKLPLNDEQNQGLVAKYVRNSDSKLDAFYAYDRGQSRLFDEVDTSD